MANTAVQTSTGRANLTAFLVGGTTKATNYIGWGLNGQSATATVYDIGLFEEAPEDRTEGTASQTTTTTTDDTYTVVGTIVAGTNETIAEVALADSATKPASTTWAIAPTGTAGTTGTLTSGTGFASGDYVQDESGEVMCLTTVAGTAVSSIVRGANGSEAVDSANGNAVTLGAIPGGTARTGGNLFVHATFSGLPLDEGDSIAFTINVKYS